MADDVIADYKLGLEYASAAAVLARRRGAAGAEFLVQWADGSAPTWEPEEHVAVEMLMAFLDSAEGKAPALGAWDSWGAAGAGAKKKGKKKQAAQKKPKPAAKAAAAGGDAPAAGAAAPPPQA